jgi:hypothetical protein
MTLREVVFDDQNAFGHDATHSTLQTELRG